MMKVVNDIVRAQNTLRDKFGEEGYKKIMNKIKEKTNNDPIILLAMYKDERYFPETRLAALAALGE